MEPLEYSFKTGPNYFYLSLSAAVCLFSIVAMVFIIKDWHTEDSHLRNLALQMAFATFFQHLILIFFFVFTTLELATPGFCKTFFIVCETTYGTMSSILASFLLLLYLMLFKNKIFLRISNLLQAIFFLINWILPLVYWILGILIEQPVVPHDKNTQCLLRHEYLMSIEESYNLVLSLVGVVIGVLIKMNYKSNSMLSKTKRHVITYIILNILYSLIYLSKLFSDNIKLTGMVKTVHRIISNLASYILPTMFFIMFCFDLKCKSKRTAFTQVDINPLDSDREDEPVAKLTPE